MNGNDPAFPTRSRSTYKSIRKPNEDVECEKPGPHGMTIRDYFAARAMQGLLSQFVSVECDSGERYFQPVYDACSAREMKACISRAVLIADALIAELSKEKPNETGIAKVDA